MVATDPRIVVHMPAEDVERLDVVAASEGLSRSQIVRRMLRWGTEYYEAYGVEPAPLRQSDSIRG